MSLIDFFRINLPYGMQKNSQDEWFVFNREYVPIGWTSTDDQQSILGNENVYDQVNIRTKYKGLTEKFIVDTIKDPDKIQRTKSGEIVRFFFYNDGDFPQSKPNHWEAYSSIIKEFSKLKSLT